MATVGTYEKEYGNEVKIFLMKGVNAILQKQITSSSPSVVEGLKNTYFLDGISSLNTMSSSDVGLWKGSFLLR